MRISDWFPTSIPEVRKAAKFTEIRYENGPILISGVKTVQREQQTQ